MRGRSYLRRRRMGDGDVVRAVEALEPRTLLSVNIAGTSGNDTISLAVGSGGSLQATVNGTTTVYPSTAYAGGITLDTGRGVDTLTISALPPVQTTVQNEGTLAVTIGSATRGVQDIAAPQLTVGNVSNPGQGTITLSVNASVDPEARTATIDANGAGTVGSTYDVLHGLGAGDIRFAVFDTTAASISLNSNAADSIVVNSLGEFHAFPQTAQTGTVTLVANHAGTQVSVGSPISQPLYIEGAAGSVALTVDESLNPTLTLQTAGPVLGNNVLGELSSGPGFSPGPIFYEASAMLQRVTVNCGNSGSTITVLNTPTNVTGGTGGPAINLNTGAGSDTVAVRGTGAATVLNVNGQDGLDAVSIGDAGSVQNVKGPVNVSNPLQFTTLTIDDSADATPRNVTLATFSSGGTRFGSITGLAPGAINFQGGDVPAVTVDAGAGGNQFAVNSLAQGTTLTLDTGNGNDQVNVTGTAPFTTLNLNGQGGNDSFLIDYTASQIAAGSTINITSGGASTLTINGLAGGSPYALTAGKITYPTSPTTSATVNYANVATLVLDPATYNVNGDLGPIALTVGANARVVFNATQHLGTLEILPGGTAALASSATPYAQTLFIDTGLVIVPGGRLDLSNNEMRLHYVAPSIVEVRALVMHAYSGGTWSDWGITTAAADATHGVGYVDSADGLVPGLASDTVLVRWARYGDLNLDGTVGFADLLRLAQNYGQLNTNWSQGDLNYDGVVNFPDLLRLAQNYGAAAAPDPALAATLPVEDLLPQRRKRRPI